MSAHREQSTLKSAYLFEGTCRCRCCVDACNAVFTLNSITQHRAGPIKHQTQSLSSGQSTRRDSSRQICPPTHHSRCQPRRHALAHWTCSTPYTGCASAHLIRISRVTGRCWIVHVSAGRRYQSSGTADWMVGSHPLLAAEAKHYLSDCKNRNRRSEISLHKFGDRPFLLNRPNSSQQFLMWIYSLVSVKC